MGRAGWGWARNPRCPPADAQILDRGTGFQRDAGMGGDSNSVIGMQKAEPLRRFITGMPKARFEPALGPATLCGLLVETEESTGKAKSIQMIRHGGVLSQSDGASSE